MGFIGSLLRRVTKHDRDSAAIEAFRKIGGDAKRPVTLRHYLYFALEYEARVVAAKLEPEGFETELRNAVLNSGVLLLARREETLDVERIHELRRRLNEMALSQKGEYDGWEAELPGGEAIAGVASRT
jgi:hypothetical protein